MLEKLDQIAVPAIVQDAMENWGLCTYDPAFLLVDPNHNDLVELQLVASVVVHELSHQW
jgi:aminopeptidase N